VAELPQFERLNQAIDALLARRDSLPPAAEGELTALVHIAGELRSLPRAEFRTRLKTQIEEKTRMKTATVNPIREGFRTLTPYLIVRPAEELLEFVKQAFGAEELMRGTGSAGGLHAEVRIGDSIVMLGGGPKLQGAPMPTSLWMYVKDADAVYSAALRAGAKSIYAPVDQPYGDREAGVTDVAGNQWYISTHKGASYVRPGMNNVNLYLHPAGAGKLIEFLKRGFGAEIVERHDLPDGSLVHANIRIGSSQMALGEAQELYPSMPTAIYMYVADTDAAYERAMAAGGKSLYAPADQPYGDRNAGVEDAWGNHWYIATHFRV
jgi:uncharacterized glyoxalase superfamily protein PhnB